VVLEDENQKLRKNLQALAQESRVGGDPRPMEDSSKFLIHPEFRPRVYSEELKIFLSHYGGIQKSSEFFQVPIDGMEELKIYLSMERVARNLNYFSAPARSTRGFEGKKGGVRDDDMRRYAKLDSSYIRDRTGMLGRGEDIKVHYM